MAALRIALPLIVQGSTPNPRSAGGFGVARVVGALLAIGAEHLSTLSTRNNLAGAYQAVGRVQDAIAIFEPLLADQERILGAEHPSTLTTRDNLAGAYWAAGRVQEATALLEVRGDGDAR